MLSQKGRLIWKGSKWEFDAYRYTRVYIENNGNPGFLDIWLDGNLIRRLFMSKLEICSTHNWDFPLTGRMAIQYSGPNFVKVEVD